MKFISIKIYFQRLFKNLFQRKAAQRSSGVNFKSGPVQSQLFSFPPDVISHLWKHPSSSRVLQMLYQTCKYFYSKRQIFVLPYTQLEQERFLSYVKPGSKTSIKYSSTAKEFEDFEWKDQYSRKWENLKQKVWFGEELRLEYLYGFSLAQKVYRCSIHTLLLFRAVITLEDFCTLTNENTIENFAMKDDSAIYHLFTTISSDQWQQQNNREKFEVPIYVIISKLPNLKKFTKHWISNHDMSLNNLQKLGQIKLQHKLKHIEIGFSYHADYSYLPLICEFIRRNAAKDCKLVFCGQESEGTGHVYVGVNNLDQNLKNALPQIEVKQF